jgi:hypothetical protein
MKENLVAGHGKPPRHGLLEEVRRVCVIVELRDWR